jgi:integrase
VLLDAGSIPAASTTEYAKPLIRQRLCRFCDPVCLGTPSQHPKNGTEMAIRLPSHLHRSRSGTLHFRIAIPPDLRHHFASREIYRSLGTASVRDAAYTAQTLSIAFKRVFCEIRQQNMPDKKKTLQRDLDGIDFGLTIDLNFDEFLRPQAGRIQTDPHDTPEMIRAAVEALAAAGAARQVLAPAPVSPTSPLFSETVADYARMKLAQGKWTEKTEEENAAVYKLFIRIVGDKPVAEIDDDIVVTYLETLQKLPANLNKSPSYAGKSIEEIVALAAPPMAARSVNKNIERISSVFKWALSKAKYGVTRNAAAGMSVSESSASKRQPFSALELITLFSGKEFSTRKFENPYAYWLMPMGLLTGARLGELCQLYLSDFVEYNGVKCIEISDEEEGQRIKNRNAKRLVPIHDKLVELGLLQYVEALRSAGEERLFPELSQRRDGFSQAASNWFQRYKKRCGIDGKHTKVFHSFRHTFISTLLDDDVAEHSVAQIVGHEAQLITGRIYWNARDAAKRKPTVEKFQLAPEVWSLVPKFDTIAVEARAYANWRPVEGMART